MLALTLATAGQSDVACDWRTNQTRQEVKNGEGGLKLCGVFRAWSGCENRAGERGESSLNVCAQTLEIGVNGRSSGVLTRVFK